VGGVAPQLCHYMISNFFIFLHLGICDLTLAAYTLLCELAAG